MTILAQLATAAGTAAVHSDLLDAIVTVSGELGDLDAVAVATRTATHVPVSAVLPLLASDRARHVRAGLAALSTRGLLEPDVVADTASDVLSTLGAGGTAKLLKVVSHTVDGQRCSDVASMDALMAILAAGLPEVLATVEDELPGWVRCAGDAGAWRRAGDDVGWTKAHKLDGELVALPAAALANPRCDGESLEALLHLLPDAVDPAAVADAVAVAASDAILVALTRTDRRWLVPAAIMAGRTGWIPAAKLVAAAHVSQLAQDHLLAACASFDADRLRALAVLAADWDGTFDELVAASGAVGTAQERT